MANVDIKVPQKDGEIQISRDGDVHAPTAHKVSAHKVSVPEEDAVHFLSVVDGSELVGGKSAAAELADNTA